MQDWHSFVLNHCFIVVYLRFISAKKQLKKPHGYWNLFVTVIKLRDCEKAVDKHSSSLRHVPNDPKFQEMREKAVEKYPWSLKYVHYNLKTQGMREKAVAYKIINEYVNKKC